MSLVNEPQEKIPQDKRLSLDGILRYILNENEEYNTTLSKNEFFKQLPSTSSGETNSFYLRTTDKQASNNTLTPNEICSNTSNTPFGFEFGTSDSNGGHEFLEASFVNSNQAHTIPQVTSYQEEPKLLPTAPQAQLVDIGM